MSTEKHGELLLSVRIRSTKWLAFGWSAVGLFLIVVVIDAVQTRRPKFAPIGALLPLMIILTHPRMKIFETGIEVPPGKDTKGMRFLNWVQIDRYSWDGNRLLLHGTQSALAGGPVEACAVKIPASRRPQIEELLKAKLPGAGLD